MMSDWRTTALDLLAKHAGWLRVTSGSMAPLILPNDEVQIRPLAQPVPGQIVVFETPLGLNTHRVLAVQGQQIYTQGDNAWQPDPPWAIGQLRGQVVAIRRGHRSLEITTPFWRGVGKVLAGLLRAGAPARVALRLLRWGLGRW